MHIAVPHVRDLILPTTRGYQREWLRPDLLAGFTVAALLVPQSLAYAQTAGMPPVTGLYSSILPVIVFALLSTSRHAAVGPTAPIAVMIPSVVTPLADGSETRYVALTGALSLLVGAISVLAGLVRLGFIVNFMSVSVLLGYITGLALVIAASQLGPLLGVQVSGTAFFDRVWDALGKLDQVSGLTLLVGMATIALLVLGKRLLPVWLPAPLAVVVLGIALSNLLDLESRGVATIGAFERGLGGLVIPDVSVGDLRAMLPGALGIALVAYVQTIAIAERFAQQHHYRVRANQEFVALGGANAAAGLVGGFSVNASLTRSAVEEQSGGRTQVANLVGGGVVALTLILLAPFFASLPTAVLAGIVMVTAIRLIEWERLHLTGRISKEEASLAAIALFGVLLFGATVGLFLAVLASLVVLVSRATRPHTAVLAYVPSQGAYRDVERYPEGESVAGMVLYRFDGPLFFANARFFSAQVRELVESSAAPVRCVLLDAEAVTHLDLSGALALLELVDDLKKQEVALVITRAKGPTYDRMRRFGVVDAVGEENYYPTNHAAVAAFERRDRSAG